MGAMVNYLTTHDVGAEGPILVLNFNPIFETVSFELKLLITFL
jgi:hypothetical protein